MKTCLVAGTATYAGFFPGRRRHAAESLHLRRRRSATHEPEELIGVDV
jgi:hypothetical protein